MKYFSTGNTVAYENPLSDSEDREPEEKDEEEKGVDNVRGYPCRGRCVLHIQAA